jgi:hypothetical protein
MVFYKDLGTIFEVETSDKVVLYLPHFGELGSLTWALERQIYQLSEDGSPLLCLRLLTNRDRHVLH